MTMISVESRRVKPTRRTARPPAPFGAGVYPRATRFEPSEEDRLWAAQSFGADADWCARMAADANGDRCEACGRPVGRGELEGGLCSVCMARAEAASVACADYGAGLGWHTS